MNKYSNKKKNENFRKNIRSLFYFFILPFLATIKSETKCIASFTFISYCPSVRTFVSSFVHLSDHPFA